MCLQDSLIIAPPKSDNKHVENEPEIDLENLESSSDNNQRGIMIDEIKYSRFKIPSKLIA